MCLAGIGNYVHPWQPPLFLAYAVAWLVGGPYLTRWAMRRYAGLPRSKTPTKLREWFQ